MSFLFTYVVVLWMPFSSLWWWTHVSYFLGFQFCAFSPFTLHFWKNFFVNIHKLADYVSSDASLTSSFQKANTNLIKTEISHHTSMQYAPFLHVLASLYYLTLDIWFLKKKCLKGSFSRIVGPESRRGLVSILPGIGLRDELGKLEKERKEALSPFYSLSKPFLDFYLQCDSWRYWQFFWTPNNKHLNGNTICLLLDS